MKRSVKIRICIGMIMAVVSADSLCLAALIFVVFLHLACSGIRGEGACLNRVDGMHLLDFSDGFSVQYASPSSCRLTAAKTPGESGVSGDQIMEGAL
jgi:hypothetical protein